MLIKYTVGAKPIVFTLGVAGSMDYRRAAIINAYKMKIACAIN